MRQQLADGVPVIRGDASVSPQMLRFIAVVRTIILWTLCGGGLAGACACRRVVFAEEVLHNHVGLVVSLCGEMGPTITSIDPAAKGFVELVKQEERKAPQMGGGRGEACRSCVSDRGQSSCNPTEQRADWGGSRGGRYEARWPLLAPLLTASILAFVPCRSHCALGPQEPASAPHAVQNLLTFVRILAKTKTCRTKGAVLVRGFPPKSRSRRNIRALSARWHTNARRTELQARHGRPLMTAVLQGATPRQRTRS